MINKYILTVVFLFNLSACSSIPKANPVILEPKAVSVVIPPELLEECVAMKALVGITVTELQVVQQVQIWSTDYANCRLQHKSLSDIVKKAFNIQ